MKKCIKAFIALSGTALLLLPQTAYACERCFGAGANGPVVQAISLSMLALLVMTVVVWGGIVTFFGNMEKRSKMLASGELVVLDNGKVVPATVAHAADRPAREADEAGSVRSARRARSASVWHSERRRPPRSP